MPNTLSRRGYSIPKEDLTDEELRTLRRKMSVKPFVLPGYGGQPKPFPVYAESPSRIYVPRHYGLKTYGTPAKATVGEYESIDVPFKGKLRPAQTLAVDAFLKQCPDDVSPESYSSHTKGGLLALHTGFGKCLGKDTPVMMYDGRIKMVQDIVVGDLIMGDDSTPRTVLSLSRGREMLYDVVPTKGEPYTVNESHILSLRCSHTSDKRVRKNPEKEDKRKKQRFMKGNIIDIEVSQFLRFSKSLRNHLLKGYRVPIDFPNIDVEIDPYILGYWLGDGHAQKASITSIEEPVISYFKKYALKLGLYFREEKYAGKCPSYHIHGAGKVKNSLLHKLRKYNLIQNKHIPHEFLCNSKHNRLQLLAGIIDSDGSQHRNGYDIIQKRENLLDDIIYLARTLGFAAYKTVCVKSCMYKGEKKTGTYYRTNIHGAGTELIPVKCPRKRARARLQIKNVLNYGIRLEKKGVGDYYGFEIDGNRRFVLGDCTVTHNTVCALNIVSQLKAKTLIVVHKTFLMNQWIERIKAFLPTARVGIIQQNRVETKDKDIVIAMLQSISMKEYPKHTFRSFGLSIFDECFPFPTGIHTDRGVMKIGSLFELWKLGKPLPQILSFNQTTKDFEYKAMTHAWRKIRTDLVKISMSKKKITCTPEHKILTVNGYVKASHLQRGDIVLCKYDTSHEATIIAPALNDDQTQIVYGSYLGDGHISFTNMERTRLKIMHGASQEEYCKWKAMMFNIHQVKLIQENGYSKKTAYSFYTKIFDLNNVFPRDSREVPDWLLEKLDPRGIAIWYMDDGSHFNGNQTSLHTNNFSKETHEKFVNKFKEYDIDCTIAITRKYYYLRFNKENARKLLQLIGPFLHKSMMYKSSLSPKENYTWNSRFLKYGTLKVSDIQSVENTGYGRCKTPYVYDIEVAENHNFIIGTKITSNGRKTYIDGPCVSNCHHLGAEVFSRCLSKVGCEFTMALSATPNRTDGLTKVFEWWLGPVVYEVTQRQNVSVNAIQITINDPAVPYSNEELTQFGKICMARMINNICNYEARTKFIVHLLGLLVRDGRTILVLSSRRQHLKDIYTLCNERKAGSVGFYVGGMKQDDLVKSESKNIILGTYNMAAEGLDIKQLNTIVFATPMTNVVQAVGRILRKVHPDIVPEIYDIVDNFSSFINQSIKRRRFYCKENYPVYCPPGIQSCEAACTAIDSLSALRIQKYSKRKKKKSIPKCLFLQE